MAIDKSNLIAGTNPVGIPGQGSRPAQVEEALGNLSPYGSSPPVRLPNFGSSPLASQSSSGSTSMVMSGTSPLNLGQRSSFGYRSSPMSIPASISGSDESSRLPSRRSARKGPARTDDLLADLAPAISFSNFSLDDFAEESDDEKQSEASFSSVSSSSSGPNLPYADDSAEAGFALISRQGRKLLRSDRVPMSQILEYEGLIFDRLATKTPRNRILAKQELFLVLTIQNPFQRSLLHAVCQYYRLHSQTVKMVGGDANAQATTVIRATGHEAPTPKKRLSEYLVSRFGHTLP